MEFCAVDFAQFNLGQSKMEEFHFERQIFQRRTRRQDCGHQSGHRELWSTVSNIAPQWTKNHATIVKSIVNLRIKAISRLIKGKVITLLI